MPTTLNGDGAAAAIAPDLGPLPLLAPKLALPNDGEAANSASLLQALQTIANHLGWSKQPKAETEAWSDEVMPFRCAAGHRRFLIDHLGLPSGPWEEYHAVWKSTTIGGDDSEFLTGKRRLKLMPEWTIETLVTLSDSVVNFDTNPYGPIATSMCGSQAGEFNCLTTGVFGYFRLDRHLVFETTAFGLYDGTRELNIGMGPISGLSHFGLASNFLGFRCSSGIWECVSRTGGSETVTASISPAVNGIGYPDRLRIEWHGDEVSDNLTLQARFYINGDLKATHTTDLPAGAKVGMGWSDHRSSTSLLSTNPAEIGPMRLRWSTANADVPY